MVKLKNTHVLLILVLSLISFVSFTSCSKDGDSETDKDYLDPEITKIISNDLLLDLEKRGMKINRGNNPPMLNKIFLVTPMKLTSRFGENDPYEMGQIVSDYLFNVYDQQGNKAKMDFKSSGADSAKGLATFLSGTDNKFTLYAELSGTSSGVDYKTVSVVTGEISNDGIVDFQYGFVLTDKFGDDGDNIMMPKNTSRIYKDDDHISPFQPQFEFKSMNYNKVNLLDVGQIGLR